MQNAVVICDEAGLKSNRQGAELLRLAQKHNMRVLLVGDVRQHVSVEAGDFLRVLEAHSKPRYTLRKLCACPTGLTMQ